jgi:hypothetical protein
MLRELMIGKRKVRVLALEVTGTGTAAIAKGTDEATLTDNGTGDYTLTFTNPGSRAIAAFVTSKTAALYGAVTALSATACTVKTYDAAASATDAAFFLLVLLADAEGL